MKLTIFQRLFFLVTGSAIAFTVCLGRGLLP